MKKSLPVILVVSAVLVSSCTFPWQKTTPETETVIENGTDVQPTNTNTTVPAPIPEAPKDITPSDTPKAIAQGGVYLPYTTTAVAQAK